MYSEVLLKAPAVAEMARGAKSGAGHARGICTLTLLQHSQTGLSLFVEKDMLLLCKEISFSRFTIQTKRISELTLDGCSRRFRVKKVYSEDLGALSDHENEELL